MDREGERGCLPWGSESAGWREYNRGEGPTQGLTLVPISAQLELFCPPCNPSV